MVVSICAFIWLTRPEIASLEPAPLTMIVLSLFMVTFSAVPRSLTPACESCIPLTSLITVPPVNTAISSSISFLLSPKPGALTAHILREPRRRFTTRVASASLSTSSAIIRRGRPDCATASRIGSMSLRLEIFLS